MARNKSRRNNGKHHTSPKWPYVVAAAAIIIALLWNDSTIQQEEMHPHCQIVMAESTIPHGGWGMFTLRPIRKADKANFGEIVIQLPDLLAEHSKAWHLLMESYVWKSFAGSGQFESSNQDRVYSVMPGFGMLANGDSQLANIASTLPQVDHAGLSRFDSAGAGANSHYHNVFWRTVRPIQAREELLVSYGSNFEKKLPANTGQYGSSTLKKSVQQLRETGMCLDNIYPQQSTNKAAGRGAFASRSMAKDSLIAPAPLLVINHKGALQMTRVMLDETTNTRREVNGQQLLLNYCFGHANSSLLFYPYSPIVNFINHDSQKANARLQWSTSPLHTGRPWLDWSIDKVKEMSLQRTGLLLEIIATRDIRVDEEIFLDYGSEFEAAWNRHQTSWKPQETSNYTYPSDVDLESLLEDNSPFSNIQTACHYHYGERAAEAAHGLAVEWRHTPLSMQTLRPCRVLSREVDSYSQQVTFTAEMLNHKSGDVIPPHSMPHVVTKISRHGIEFKDRPYHSDQHLPNAFRHAIGIPTSIFPKQWMDLT